VRGPQRSATAGANSRRGTAVAVQPPLRVRGARPLPANTRDLASGNPDPALPPPLAPALAHLDPEHKLYGGPVKLARLAELAEADFAADGIAADIAVVGGALDGIERTLQTQLRPGDRVVVEDPCWPRINDLVRSLGLQPEPSRIDQRGFVIDELTRALKRGSKAIIATPRGQNPTGVAVDRERGRLLRELLGRHPDVIVIEDRSYDAANWHFSDRTLDIDKWHIRSVVFSSSHRRSKNGGSTMAFRTRAKGLRLKLVLMAVAPVVGMAGVGIATATPALAVPMNCNSGYNCFYIDINDSPSTGDWVANFQGGNSYWGNFWSPNLYCSPAYSWNDCASSGQGQIGENMILYVNANCGGSTLTVHVGQDIDNFGNSGFNDVTSSDKVGSTC